MNPRHVYVATPAYTGACASAYAWSLAATSASCAHRGIGLTVDILPGDAFIVRARNTLVANFLESTASHLLFADSDQGWDPDSVFRMLDFDQDVVAGVVARKATYWKQVAEAARAGVVEPEKLEAASVRHNVRFPSDGRTEVHSTPSGHFVEVQSVGTGFMLIKRVVLKRMIAELGETIAYRDAGAERYRIFDTDIDPDAKEFVGEDIVFCRRWRAMGGRLFASLDTRITHAGTCTWTNAPSRLLTTTPDAADQGVRVDNVRAATPPEVI